MVFVSSGADNDTSGMVFYEGHEDFVAEVHTHVAAWTLVVDHLHAYWAHFAIIWNELNQLTLHYDGGSIQTSNYRLLFDNPNCTMVDNMGCANLTGESLIFGKTVRDVDKNRLSSFEVADIVLAEYSLENSEIERMRERGELSIELMTHQSCGKNYSIAVLLLGLTCL